MPTGRSRRPKSDVDSPAAPRARNRFISAIPSSRCCPSGPKTHFCVEGTRSARKVSGTSVRSKSPRRFTQGPRLVETVTSGDMVTIRSASGPPALAIPSRILPKAACVEISRSATGARRGTGTAASESRRMPLLKKGAARAARVASAGTSHSVPGATPIAACQVSNWPGVIRPAWLSLCPASGVPQPLIV